MSGEYLQGDCFKKSNGFYKGNLVLFGSPSHICFRNYAGKYDKGDGEVVKILYHNIIMNKSLVLT